MQQRNSSANPHVISTLNPAQLDDSVLCISTVDPNVRSVFEAAFAQTSELRFYRSVTELHFALPTVTAQNAVVLIDLDSEIQHHNQTNFPKVHRHLPLILLSSELDVETCREHFQAGVEDILQKPLNRSELIVKTEKALSGVQKTVRNYLEFLGVLEAELTITELRILSHFFEHPARTANRKSLTDHIWNQDRVHPKALDVHLFNLRTKLAKAKLRIDYEPQLKGWRLKSQEA